jgi:hypothetical protein
MADKTILHSWPSLRIRISRSESAYRTTPEMQHGFGRGRGILSFR